MAGMEPPALGNQENGDSDAVLGGGWPCCHPNGYPAVTRSQNRHVFFCKVDVLARFGTEGSVVRIHSPRPKIPNEFERSVCGVTPFHFGNRVTGRLNPTFAPLYTQTVGFSGDCCHSTVVSRATEWLP